MQFRLRSLVLVSAMASLLAVFAAAADPKATDDTAAREHLAAAKEHHAKGEYLPAIDECYFAILEKPDFFAAHFQRGLAYLARHEYDKAIRTFDRALQLDAKSSLSLSHRGFAHGALGRFDACIADQEKALELDATLVGLSASHKSRGLGDCWGHQSWVWDGRQFVHTASSSHGLCRGFPGGAWDMPTRVVEVLKDHSR